MVILQKTYFQMIQKQFTRCIKGQRGDPPWMRIESEPALDLQSDFGQHYAIFLQF